MLPEILAGIFIVLVSLGLVIAGFAGFTAEREPLTATGPYLWHWLWASAAGIGLLVWYFGFYLSY